MAKIKHRNGNGKSESRPAEATREHLKSPAYVSLYVNDLQLQTSPWDVRIILGEIINPATHENPVMTVNQIGELRMSPQLAKRLTEIMLEQLKNYEERFGNIPAIKI